LNDNPDKPVWKYTKSGIFSVKSLYAKLSAVVVDRSFKQLWKAKLPLKIQIWLWLIWHNTVAIRDNMKKRGWWETTLVNSVKLKNQLNIFSLIALLLCTCGVQSVASTGSFCFTQYFWWIAKFLPVGPNLHIVAIAAFCWSIWKTRNRSCF
jgi:hypothetical protein